MLQKSIILTAQCPSCGKDAKTFAPSSPYRRGGISDCGNAQNCVEVCPKNIPLTDSIAAIGRDVTVQAFRDLFSLSDRTED